MKTIVVASINKLKQAVVEEAAKAIFPAEQLSFVPVDGEIGGPEPFGEDELQMHLGEAIKKVGKLYPSADYYVAMEGGVVETLAGMEEMAIVRIDNADGKSSVSRSVSFPIPPVIAEKVRQGISFGDAVDQTYATQNIKTTKGFIGLLTDSIVDKKALYFQPTVVAFAKFVKKEWYWKV